MSSSAPSISDSVLRLARLREHADGASDARTVLVGCLIGVAAAEASALADQWLTASQRALSPDPTAGDQQALQLVADALHVPVDYFRTLTVRALVDSWTSLCKEQDQGPPTLAIQGPCRSVQLAPASAAQVERRLMQELPTTSPIARREDGQHIRLPGPDLSDPFAHQPKGAPMLPAEEQTRSYTALATLARRKLSKQGLSPPLDLEVLRQALEQCRGTTITLVPTDEIPLGSAFAVTGRQDNIEVVLYESRTTPLHQTLIVLHEFAHMLLEHPPSVVLHSQDALAPFREIDAAAVAAALGRAAPRHPVSASARLRRRLVRPRSAPATEATASSEPSAYARVCEHEAETLATILLDWLPGATRSTERVPADSAVEQLTEALGHRWSPR